MQPAVRRWREVLVATALALLGAACSVTGPPKDNMAISYLALGDSYTIGEGVPDAGRWPVQLATALRREGVALVDPRIIAATGWTTDELSAAIDATEPLGSFDFVSLLSASTTSIAAAAWPSTAVSSPRCSSARSGLPAAAPTACWCCRSRTGA